MNNSIAIFGMGRAPIKTVEALFKKNIKNIIAFPDQTDGTQSWRPSFREYCREKQIEYITLPDINDKRVLKILESRKVSMIISSHSEVIFPKKVIDLLNGQVFNIHFGLLPKCRGLFPTFWHILNGDKFGGITLHKIKPTIDSGEVIDQIKIPINQDTTTWSLYLDSSKNTKDIVFRNIDALMNNTYRAVAQRDEKSSYFSKKSVNFSENFVNWNLDVERVSRFIQAFIFPPLQFPRVRHKKRIHEIKKIVGISKSKAVAAPGTIVSRENDILTVQAKNGFCKIKMFSLTGIKVSERFYY